MNMNAPGFCHWLSGVLDTGATIDAGRSKMIRDRLNDVFLHDIDPSFPAHQQDALSAAHEGTERPRC